MSESLAIGDVIEVVTERIAYGGDAVARFGGIVVFVPLAAPEERLRVRVIEKKRRFARAVIEEVMEPGLSRRSPPCCYVGRCGGCQLQQLTYDAQLAIKSDFIRDSLLRIGGLDWPQQIEVRHAAEFGYRLRAQLKVEKGQTARTVRIGFHRMNSKAVCDIEECPVLVPPLNDGLKAIRQCFQRKTNQQSPLSSEIEIAAGNHQVASQPDFFGRTAADIEIKVGEFVYQFSPQTFFQSNAFLLDELVGETVGSETGDLAVDLYAGVGLFTLPLAKRYQRVIGVESDTLAAAYAKSNLARNQIANVDFYSQRVEMWLAEKQRRLPLSPVELIVLDPPRTGAAGILESLAVLRPHRLCYVSCDPTTLARDVRVLTKLGFQLTRVVAFDLFPQTYHVETVAHFQLT